MEIFFMLGQKSIVYSLSSKNVIRNVGLLQNPSSGFRLGLYIKPEDGIKEAFYSHVTRSHHCPKMNQPLKPRTERLFDRRDNIEFASLQIYHLDFAHNFIFIFLTQFGPSRVWKTWSIKQKFDLRQSVRCEPVSIKPRSRSLFTN